MHYRNALITRQRIYMENSMPNRVCAFVYISAAMGLIKFGCKFKIGRFIGLEREKVRNGIEHTHTSHSHLQYAQILMNVLNKAL